MLNERPEMAKPWYRMSAKGAFLFSPDDFFDDKGKTKITICLSNGEGQKI